MTKIEEVRETAKLLTLVADMMESRDTGKIADVTLLTEALENANSECTPVWLAEATREVGLQDAIDIAKAASAALVVASVACEVTAAIGAVDDYDADAVTIAETVAQLREAGVDINARELVAASWGLSQHDAAKALAELRHEYDERGYL